MKLKWYEMKRNEMKWSEKEIAESVLREVRPLWSSKFRELIINWVMAQVNGFDITTFEVKKGVGQDLLGQ